MCNFCQESRYHFNCGHVQRVWLRHQLFCNLPSEVDGVQQLRPTRLERADHFKPYICGDCTWKSRRSKGWICHTCRKKNFDSIVCAFCLHKTCINCQDGWGYQILAPGGSWHEKLSLQSKFKLSSRHGLSPREIRIIAPPTSPTISTASISHPPPSIATLLATNKTLSSSSKLAAERAQKRCRHSYKLSQRRMQCMLAENILTTPGAVPLTSTRVGSGFPVPPNGTMTVSNMLHLDEPYHFTLAPIKKLSIDLFLNPEPTVSSSAPSEQPPAPRTMAALSHWHVPRASAPSFLPIMSPYYSTESQELTSHEPTMAATSSWNTSWAPMLRVPQLVYSKPSRSSTPHVPSKFNPSLLYEGRPIKRPMPRGADPSRWNAPLDDTHHEPTMLGSSDPSACNAPLEYTLQQPTMAGSPCWNGSRRSGPTRPMNRTRPEHTQHNTYPSRMRSPNNPTGRPAPIQNFTNFAQPPPTFTPTIGGQPLSEFMVPASAEALARAAVYNQRASTANLFNNDFQEPQFPRPPPFGFDMEAKPSTHATEAAFAFHQEEVRRSSAAKVLASMSAWSGPGDRSGSSNGKKPARRR